MQTQDIARNDSNITQSNNYSSDSNITQSNNYTLELCEIVASFYLVQSVTDDNTTSSLLGDLENTATATLEFWVSVM